MIDISLNFSADGLAENLTFVLAKRDCSKIGLLSNPQDVTASISCEDAPEISVKFYKEENPYWNDINRFKLIYIPELDTYFAIQCDTSEGDGGEYKALTCKRLAESELEQINVYGLQINTEEEIILPDYDSNFPNVLYRDPTDIEAYDDIWNSDEKYAEYTNEQKSQTLRNSSILHRVLSFAPHYTIGTVDESIQDIQRIFSFDNTSIYECLNQIAEEMSVIFDFTGRTVNVYDALSSCDTCGYRGHFTGTCPNCGGTSVTEGFGENTGICISTDALGTNLTYQRNEEALKNCYHIAGGDEIMTAAIRNCNPNGGYVWSFSDETKDEMSSGLKTALNTYESLYNDYQTTHSFPTSGLPLSDYNALINKYKALDSDVKIDTITSITGYSELIKAYYNAIDFGEYLNNGLYPSITNNGKTAAQVIAGLTQAALSPVSLFTTEGLTLSSASNAVVSYARIISDPLFDIKVLSQELLNVNDVYTWVGVLSATNYYDKDDTAKTGTLRIVVNSDITNFAQNSVKQTLLNRSKGNAEIINLYAMTDQELTNAVKYYSYQALSSLNDCFVKSVETLTSIGADDSESDAHAIYTTTTDKLSIIATELALRESEVQLVDFKDSTTSMVALLKAMIDSAKSTMKLENNLTALQWTELNSFRQESDYSNDNYVSTSFRKKFDYVDSQFISDALSNAELIKRAYEFLMQAEYKIKENNKYSYQINTSLQNLLAIPEFASLRSSFKCGNWLRVMDKNGQLYKLRLMKYEIDWNDLSTIDVEFADVSLNDAGINQMQKFMMKTQDVVDKFGKSTNQNQSNLVNKSGDLSNDYNYSDAYTGSESYQNIEIMNNQVTTKFNIVDGLIQGKISAADALSLIAQELGKITLSVVNGNKASTITISYDDVSISTTGDINLGGTVTFTDDLVDGATVISGDNILTGEIMSANYQFRTGQTFSDHGSLFSLINGIIRTPHLYSGEDGLHVKGTIEADAGRIGGFEILTTGDSYSLDHAQHAWKLRSAPVAGQVDRRYYVSLTKNRNLIVSDSASESHTASNDTTPDCNIGTKNYPWRYGYFKRLYNVYQTSDNGVVTNNRVPLGVEYVKVTLAAADWDANGQQTVNIVGITKDNDISDKTKQFLTIVPAYADAVDYFNMGIVVIQKKKGQLVFQRLWTLDSTTPDVDVFIYAQYAKPRQMALDMPYNPSIYYSTDDERTYCTWQDPDDEMFAVLDHVYLFRRYGAAPEITFANGSYTITDGESVKLTDYDVSERDKYKSTAYEDTTVAGLTAGRYYYTIYEVTSEDQYSYYTDTINTGNAPFITSVSLNDDEGQINYELMPAHYRYLKILYKVGSAPTTSEDGVLVADIRDLTIESISQRYSELSDLPIGNLYFKIFAETDDGQTTSNTYIIDITGTYEFAYTGQIQQFTVPVSGRYKLEAWGAQGAEDGGVGSYSVGEVELTQGDVLYIAVGGQNGFNGGGDNTLEPPVLKELTLYEGTGVTVDYKIYPGTTYPYTTIKLVAKKNSVPQSKTDGDKIVDLSASSTQVTVTELEEQTKYYFKIFAEDGSGNLAASDALDITTDVDTGYNFAYTGQIQTFTVPKSGVYSLETWGAQGGDATDGTNTARGGYGAYAYGEVLLQQGETVYINVGGQNGYGGGGNYVAPNNNE